MIDRDSIETFHKTAKLVAYERELRFVFPRPVPSGKSHPPRRHEGDISRFSRKSRLRLIRTLNRIQTPVLGQPVFVTLTFRHGSIPEEVVQEAFLKRFLPLLNKIIPEMVYMWRMEPHKDGVRHYHLLVWSRRKDVKLASEYYKAPMRKLWRTCIGEESGATQKYSCKVLAIDSFEKAASYVNKYIAKEPDSDVDDLIGRRWGVSTNMPCSPITDVNLTRTQYEAIIERLRAMFKGQAGRLKYLEYREHDHRDWFIWLSTDEMEQIISSPPAQHIRDHYKNFQDHGDIYPSNDELAELAADLGKDF